MKIGNNLKYLIIFIAFSFGFFVTAQKSQAANCAWLSSAPIPCQGGAAYSKFTKQLDSFCVAEGIAKPTWITDCCCDPALIGLTVRNDCVWDTKDATGKCLKNPKADVLPSKVCIDSGLEYKFIGQYSTNLCCCGNIQTSTVPLVASKPAAVLNNPFDNLNIEIPGLYKSLGCIYNQKTKKYECPKVNCEEGDNGAASCNVPWIGQYIIAIYNYALIVIGSIAAVTIMMGGLLWLISGSNASRMKVAKEMIVGSISGLVIMFSSYMIISVVNPSILIFKPLSIGYIEPYPPDEPMSTGEVNEPSVFDDACKIYQKTKSTKACQDLVGKEPANLSNLFGGGQQRLNADFAQKVKVALKCVKDKNGGKDMFYVSAGVRTAEVSMRLYNTYIKDPKNANQAAQPCCSRHMTGNAVDLQRTSYKINWFNPNLPKEKKAKFIDEQWAYVKSVGLVDCMKQAGIPGGFVDSEPWHWSTSGR